MAHYSYLSPDKKSVLLAEMDPEWHPCRVVPFAGGSQGVEVGPQGECTSAAWSRDGKSVYVGVKVAGRQHLWRQRFPDGKPEQLTFGSTEEDGIAMAPDGHSLITSVFTRHNAVVVHDARGDHPVSTQGYADGLNPIAGRPVYSPDGKRLYSLLRRDSPESPAELYVADLVTGNSSVILPGVSIREFDIGRDEKDAVYSVQPAGQPSEIWITPLSRATPPRKIASAGASHPHFGPNNEIYFRRPEGNASYLTAMQRDGSLQRKAFPRPVSDIFTISPDQRFILIVTSFERDPTHPGNTVLALPLGGGEPRQVCSAYCSPAWSPDGRYFSVEIDAQRSNADPQLQTVVIPVPAGKTLPDFPPGVVEDQNMWAKVPGVKNIARRDIVPGMDPSTYAYIQPSVHGNLYRIPLP